MLCSTYLTKSSSPIIPGVLRKAPYKKVLLGICVSTILSKNENHISRNLIILIAGVCVYMAIIYKLTSLLYASVILNGFCNLSIFGVMCELVVEVSYPQVGEATSVGFLNVIINIL